MDERGIPDPLGTFTIKARSIGGTPSPIWPLILDFSGCPDVSVCSAYAVPGGTVTCDPTTRQITFPQSPTGNWTITLIGGVTNRANAATSGCMKVFAGPFLLRGNAAFPAVTVAALDQSGGDGLTMADFSLLLGDALSGTYFPRSDFDHGVACQGLLNGADLSIWLTSFLGGYAEGCRSKGGTLCP